MEEVFSKEKKYLQTVSSLIDEEIQTTSLRHKKIKEEKLTFEDRRRGQHLNNNAIMDMLYHRIKKLNLIKSNPYFGRLDFIDGKTNVKDIFYIGKTNISDDKQKLYTVDWRTPVASLYYDNSLGNASYKAPQGTIKGEILLKRQIIIEDFILKKVLDIDIVGRDAILQEYLEVHATNRMKDIVASIQKEQNEIIRQDINKNIIVQGIAGSGKTSVALHRIAYLIYQLNNRQEYLNFINSKQFMIIGPNPYFLDYISSVLPDLDVEKANQLTLSNLLDKVIKEKITIEDQSTELQRYFKDKKTKESSINYLDFEYALNKYVEDLIDYYEKTDLKYDNKIIFDGKYVSSLLNGREFKMLNRVKSVEKQLINRVKYESQNEYSNLNKILIQDISNQILKLPNDSKKSDELFKKRNLIRTEMKKGFSKNIKAHFKKLNQTILKHYIDFINNLENYIDMNNIDEYKKETLKRLRKKQLRQDDIAMLLTLYNLLESNIEFNDTIHIIIDEAQDLNLLEFKAIKNLFPNATFSIFGDLNQAIFSYRGIDNWESVKNEVFGGNSTKFELNQSYRTTNEIMIEANKISDYLTNSVSKDIIRHGDDVDYIKSDRENIFSNIENLLAENLKQGYKSIAIITKTENEALEINNYLKNLDIQIHNVTSNDEKYDGGLCTIASSLVKGLEFDATILVGVDNYKIENDIDMKLLYVAMTRALHKNSIVYTNKLPPILEKKMNKTYK